MARSSYFRTSTAVRCEGLNSPPRCPNDSRWPTVAARLADFDGARTALQEPVRFQVGPAK